MQKLQVGNRVRDRVVRKAAVIVRTDVQGERPRQGASAMEAAAHRPGALIYVARHLGRRIPIEAFYEEHEIELAGS